ncbi:MAG TPA: glycogen/starch synthase [Planctomycetota bacterium]|nr:glycogen/starch synthase [Planctomycetota bacterium]
MKIAFVTPELQSLVRRTNLAEISEALPRTLREAGHDVRVFMPFTRDVNTFPMEGLDPCGSVTVQGEHGPVTLNLHQGLLGDLPIILFDHEKLFRNRHPYGDENGPYADNWLRFSVFARGVLAALEELPFSADILHCLDWTTGLVPVYRELEYLHAKPDHPASRAGVYFAIHNLAMQGSFEREILPRIGLPMETFQHIRGVALDGRVNYLKAGAEFATVIGTHSPAQAQRIQHTDRGYGLEETFQRRKKELVGVTNGIDYSTWDPGSDELLAQTFSAGGASPGSDSPSKDFPGKRRCKAALQDLLKLDRGPRTPIVGVIGRFDADSGCDLLAEIMTDVLERNFEVVMMGSGQAEILDRIRTIESTFMGRCRLIDGYHVQVAHQLLAGIDMLALPSHYQPSNALCAIGMRYGAVPIVYEHSGLDDTVTDLADDPAAGTGFFFRNYSGAGLLEALDDARIAYKSAATWKETVRRCLQLDFSWQATATNYLKAYRRVTRRVKAQLEEE